MQLVDLGALRPPCSVAEAETAEVVARQMRGAGLRPTAEALRVSTSPSWAPLLRALLRLWSAAFLAAGWPAVAVGLGATSLAGGFRAVTGLVRFVPVLGGRSVNVVAARRGTDNNQRPLVVTAHLDTHPTSGAPLRRPHNIATALSGALAFVVGVVSAPGTSAWRPVAAAVAVESLVTLAWLARSELSIVGGTPDDNTSGLLALVRLAELLADGTQARTVWLVATTGATSGSHGVTRFLKKHRELRVAWLIDIDALGRGEVIASPHAARFRHPGTPASLVAALSAAARASGDPLTVRRARRPHSDARAALRARTPAITLTEGLRPPRGRPGPDAANAERAARIIDTLARSRDGEPSAPTPPV